MRFPLARVVAVTLSLCLLASTVPSVFADTEHEPPDIFHAPRVEMGPLPFDTKYYTIEFQAPYGASFTVSGEGKLLFSNCYFSAYLAGQGVGYSSFQEIGRYPEVRGGVTRDGIHEIRCEVVTDLLPPSALGSVVTIETVVQSGSQGVASFWRPWVVGAAEAQGGKKTVDRKTTDTELMQVPEVMDIKDLPQTGLYEANRRVIPMMALGATPRAQFGYGWTSPTGKTRTFGWTTAITDSNIRPKINAYFHGVETPDGEYCIPTHAWQWGSDKKWHKMKPLQLKGKPEVTATIEIRYKKYPDFPQDADLNTALKTDTNLIWLHEYEHFKIYKKMYVDDMKLLYEQWIPQYPVGPFVGPHHSECEEELQKKIDAYVQMVKGSWCDAYKEGDCGGELLPPKSPPLPSEVPTSTFYGVGAWRNARHDLPEVWVWLMYDTVQVGDRLTGLWEGRKRIGATGNFNANSQPDDYVTGAGRLKLRYGMGNTVE